MIVGPSVLKEFGNQVRRKRKVGMLVGDLCRSFLGYQAGYLGSTLSEEELGDASKLSDAMYTTKISFSKSSTAAANSEVYG